MSERRATLGIFTHTAAFLTSRSCRVAGRPMSKRLDLMAQRYTEMTTALTASTTLTDPELATLAELVQSMSLRGIRDAGLLPGVVRRAMRDAPDGGTALSSIAFKLERASNAALLAVVDACENVALPST